MEFLCSGSLRHGNYFNGSTRVKGLRIINYRNLFAKRSVFFLSLWKVFYFLVRKSVAIFMFLRQHSIKLCISFSSISTRNVKFYWLYKLKFNRIYWINLNKETLKLCFYSKGFQSNDLNTNLLFSQWMSAELKKLKL